jgi:hypothetical protein
LVDGVRGIDHDRRPAEADRNGAQVRLLGVLWVWRLDYVLAQIFHTPGEILGVGSLLILLPVCLVMLGVGVRAALRAASQPN